MNTHNEYRLYLRLHSTVDSNNLITYLTFISRIFEKNSQVYHKQGCSPVNSLFVLDSLLSNNDRSSL